MIVLLFCSVKKNERRLAATLAHKEQMFQDVSEGKKKLDEVWLMVDWLA